MRASSSMRSAAAVLLLVTLAAVGVQAWYPSGSMPSQCQLGKCDMVTQNAGVNANVRVDPFGRDSDPANKYFQVTVTASGLRGGDISAVYVGFTHTNSGTRNPNTAFIVKNSPQVNGNVRVAYDSTGISGYTLPACSGQKYTMVVPIVPGSGSKVVFRIYPPANSHVDFRGLDYAVRIVNGWTDSCKDKSVFQLECGSKPGVPAVKSSTGAGPVVVKSSTGTSKPAVLSSTGPSGPVVNPCVGNVVKVTCDQDVVMGDVGNKDSPLCYVKITPALPSYCPCPVDVNLAMTLAQEDGMFNVSTVTFTPGGPAVIAVELLTCQTTPLGDVQVFCSASSDCVEPCTATCEGTTFPVKPAGEATANLGTCIPVNKPTTATVALSIGAPGAGYSLQISLSSVDSTVASSCTVSQTIDGVTEENDELSFDWQEKSLDYTITCTKPGTIVIDYLPQGVTAGFIDAPNEQTFEIKTEAQCAAAGSTGGAGPNTPPVVVTSCVAVPCAGGVGSATVTFQAGAVAGTIAGKVEFGGQGVTYGDLRGLFIDFSSKSFIDHSKCVITGTTITQSQLNTNSLSSQSSANLNGCSVPVTGGSFDVAAAIGTEGAGKDDIRSMTFVLACAGQVLTTQSLSGATVGVRVMSTGTSANSREGSLKLSCPLPCSGDNCEVTPPPVVVVSSTGAAPPTEQEEPQGCVAKPCTGGSGSATVTFTKGSSAGTLTGKVVFGDEKVAFGDLRGIFIDFASSKNIDSSRCAIVGADITKSAMDVMSIPGQCSANMNGCYKGQTGQTFDVAASIGTQGKSKDDIRSTTFTLSCAGQVLTTDSVEGALIGVRVTSVGKTSSSRCNSLKLSCPVGPLTPPTTPPTPPTLPPVVPPPTTNPPTTPCIDQCPWPLVTCPGDNTRCRLRLSDCEVASCPPKKGTTTPTTPGSGTVVTTPVIVTPPPAPVTPPQLGCPVMKSCDGDSSVQGAVKVTYSGRVATIVYSVAKPMFADIRGVFFDVQSDDLRRMCALTHSNAKITDIQTSCWKVNGDVEIAGCKDKNNKVATFDYGFGIGTSGLGKDDVRTLTLQFTCLRNLKDSDFLGANYGLRITSVGETETSRTKSAKLTC